MTTERSTSSPIPSALLTSGLALLLVGEPGTAKSMLSELLAAAISGSSIFEVVFVSMSLGVPHPVPTAYLFAHRWSANPAPTCRRHDW